MKFKLVKESLNEDNIDKVRERRFGIIDTGNEEKHYSKSHKEDVNEIIVKQGKWELIMNPSSLSGFDRNVRAVVLKNGDLYVENIVGKIHSDMLYDLVTHGELKADEHIIDDTWHRYLPDTFLTIRRDKDTNVFLVGESNIRLADEIGDRWGKGKNEDERDWAIIDVYDEFLEAARKKHPNFRFSELIHLP